MRRNPKTWTSPAPPSRSAKRSESRAGAATRRVPLSTRAIEVLTAWMRDREGLPFLFSRSERVLSPQAAQKGFERAVKNCKWKVMRGWHVLRHSFISALASKGVDQRLIDDFVGHQTEEQRRRYRHLLSIDAKGSDSGGVRLASEHSLFQKLGESRQSASNNSCLEVREGQRLACNNVPHGNVIVKVSVVLRQQLHTSPS